jgi:hypothetical protein
LELSANAQLSGVQRVSYERFLQMGVAPDQRTDVGLQGVFKSVFPIRDSAERAQLDFLRYELDAPKYDVGECQERGITYAAPLKATLHLVLWDVDQDTGSRSIRDIKEQDVYMGEMPLMTMDGTFLINGTICVSSAVFVSVDSDSNSIEKSLFRPIGDLMENAFRAGLLGMKRLTTEKMNGGELDYLLPHNVLNAGPLASAVRECVVCVLKAWDDETLRFEYGYRMGHADGRSIGRSEGQQVGLKEGYRDGHRRGIRQAVNHLLRIREDILREELVPDGVSVRRRRYLRQAVRLLTDAIDHIHDGRSAI